MAPLSTAILSALAAFTTAFPTTILTPRLTPAESWHIPRLTMHMMSSSTGIPGNPPWPANARFNSTIDFDVLIPDRTVAQPANNSGQWPSPGTLKVNCQAQWENGTLPASTMSCIPVVLGQAGPGDSQTSVQFGMSEYEGSGVGVSRPEMSFLLHLLRSDGVEDDDMQGEVAITANTPSNPSSYLTCLLGAPYDGLRCNIGSYLSVRNELIVGGTSLPSRGVGVATD
ncbi:hypothetical protein EJ02DRAFT_369892 [Clathrospora elynae]|uniref:Ubiquitin 3 binding protein But2 C-terminal domain-containing protein n=1 Tax=Clathrospora elynae TaxID=706981 RepID=A0A6A5SXD6_9PLEO|nr:hypothetical protein EJ02DRAFT_369892 [Clathrospora elynae]